METRKEAFTEQLMKLFENYRECATEIEKEIEIDLFPASSLQLKWYLNKNLRRLYG